MPIADRMVRAVRGEVALFEEVEHDPAATVEALTVVVVAALAGGVGLALAQLAQGRPGAALGGLALGIISALVGWAAFAAVNYWIGVHVFHADATWEEVLRTVGYAESPMVAQIVAFVPCLGGLIALAAGLWTLYLVFLALRSALDLDSGKTIATILLSLIPTVIITALILVPFGGMR